MLELTLHFFDDVSFVGHSSCRDRRRVMLWRVHYKFGLSNCLFALRPKHERRFRACLREMQIIDEASEVEGKKKSKEKSRAPQRCSKAPAGRRSAQRTDAGPAEPANDVGMQASGGIWPNEPEEKCRSPDGALAERTRGGQVEGVDAILAKRTRQAAQHTAFSQTNPTEVKAGGNIFGQTNPVDAAVPVCMPAPARSCAGHSRLSSLLLAAKRDDSRRQTLNSPR